MTGVQTCALPIYNVTALVVDAPAEPEEAGFEATDTAGAGGEESRTGGRRAPENPENGTGHQR